MQEQSEFKDGSAIRLTIARYYTPSGRSIQKPYENGQLEDYYHDEMERYESGELVNADSVKMNKKLKYTTPSGKVVYGGGGIMPDYFIPIDTTKVSKYISELLYKNVINDFALEYVNQKRAQLKYANAATFNEQFQVNNALFNDLKTYANKNNVKTNASDLGKGFDLLSTHLKAYIAKDIFNQEAWFLVKNSHDEACKKALKELYHKN